MIPFGTIHHVIWALKPQRDVAIPVGIIQAEQVNQPIKLTIVNVLDTVLINLMQLILYSINLHLMS